MATLIPESQRFVDVPGRPDLRLGITRVKLISTSDTFTVPDPAHSTASASCAALRAGSEAACTVTQSSNTVTCAGTAGETITVVTLHIAGNNMAEA